MKWSGGLGRRSKTESAEFGKLVVYPLLWVKFSFERSLDLAGLNLADLVEHLASCDLTARSTSHVLSAPISLLKSEQQKIAKQLAAINSEIKAHECAFESISERLSEALKLVEDCGRTYRMASDHIKRMMNQAIFSNLWVEKDGRITAEFAPIFQMLTQPAEDVKALYKQQKIRGAETLTDFLSVISNRIQKFFGCGWSNDLLVPETGLEPARLATYAPKAYVYTNFTTRA